MPICANGWVFYFSSILLLFARFFFEILRNSVKYHKNTKKFIPILQKRNGYGIMKDNT